MFLELVKKTVNICFAEMVEAPGYVLHKNYYMFVTV
jgi:hypothetical protein